MSTWQVIQIIYPPESWLFDSPIRYKEIVFEKERETSPVPGILRSQRLPWETPWEWPRHAGVPARLFGGLNDPPRDRPGIPRGEPCGWPERFDLGTPVACGYNSDQSNGFKEVAIQGKEWGKGIEKGIEKGIQ